MNPNEDEIVKSDKSWIKIKGLRLVRITMPDSWTKKKMKVFIKTIEESIEDINKY